MRSVPPKKEGGAGKDGTDKSGKGEEKGEEAPKTPEDRLKEAVRDAQVLAHPSINTPMQNVCQAFNFFKRLIKLHLLKSEPLGTQQVSFLKQLKRDTPEEEAAYEKLEKDLLKEHPKHLPLLSARLASINSVSSDTHPKKFEVHNIIHGCQHSTVLCAELTTMGFTVSCLLFPY